MKTLFALAVLGATAALGLALGPSSREKAEPLRASVVRYVNMNKVFETAERFREEREAMTKRWEGWKAELDEFLKQGQAMEKSLSSFTGLKSSPEYRQMIEELEVLSYRAGKKKERYAEQQSLEQTQAILKWSEDVDLAIAVYAKAQGIDVVLQNWPSDSGAEDGLSLKERYSRILNRSAAHLDPALDISQEIASSLK
ncbi:MAG: OmpH family outer membrane protein [Planctomycetes bacterium]|nr:OmpH family outer membrane protein [Planctomycetota bacterium]